MELSELIFKSNTTDLERVSKVIGDLVTDISKLDKASRDAAKTEATLAKAAKDNAKANLDNAKAQDTRLKSTITADKADQQAAAAIEKKTKATERATVAAKRNVDMLQLQNDTYDFILEGFSKGDAKVLAMAKATGQLSDQLKQVLTDIRQFSKNTFDQTETGLDRMVKSAKEASVAQGFLNQGFNLTAKQAKELGNDLDRLNIRLQHQGKSYDEIVKAQAVYKQQFLEEAKAVNQANNALASVEKQRKDVVSATNYLTQADAKMAAALNTSNAALDKAGTDSLVKYETALRKSGVSQDVATAKLATYKAQLAQVSALEQKRREQHLARALSPQLTDIGVSLYSGQAPLTVLLQQGGQIADLLRLSGVEAQNFGKALRDAFSSMIPVMATVANGLGQFAFGLFQEAGAGVVNFIGKVTGISAAMEIAKRAIASGGEENFRYIASLQRIGAVASTVAATGIAALIALLATMALEYKKIIQLESELSVALATSGGALGITKDQTIATAQSMEVLGIGTLKAMSAFAEIAKAGNIGKESLELVAKAAIDLEKTAGISIEETAKQYAELQEDPAKALTEIAQKTGLVDKATLDYVYSLEQQGDKTEAARIATLALASAHAQVASEIRDNWSPIEALWNDIKSAIGRVKQEIYDLTTSNAVVGALRTVWETVAVIVSEVWFTIKGVGREIGGIGAQIAAVMSGNFSQAAEIGRQMKADAAAARQAQDEFTAALLNRSEQETKFFNQNKEQNSEYAKWRRENDQALDKSISKSDKYKAKELEMQKAVLAGTVSQIEADKALAGWKKIIFGEEKTKKDPSKNYYATLMREATNNTIAATNATEGLTKSELKLLEIKADPRFKTLTATQQADVTAKYEGAIAAEKQTLATEKLAEAEAFRLKLLGKSEGIGKQYYADMQKLEEFAKVAGWSREEIEELTRAVFKQTPAWKAYEKALEDVNTASRKFQEDSLASQASVLQENRSLDHRLSLLGRTAEEQKAITIEYQRANKIREVDIKLARQLREIEEKIAEAKKKGLPESDYQALIDAEIQARKDAAEQHKVINREVAVQYAEDLQKEIDAIRNGITDSIVTALFEGGKAGSKKLRDVLVNTLRQKVTIVVDAVVNTLLGNVTGGLLGGGSASAAGSVAGAAGSSTLGSVGGSLFGKAVTGSAGSFLGAGSFTGMLSNVWSGITTGFSTLFTEGVGAWLSQGTGLMSAGATGGGLGALAGPISAVLLLATNWKKLFGRTLKDSGIQGEFGGDTGFEGQQYKFYKGGLFRSNKTELSPLDEAVRKTFADSFTAMKQQVVGFANVLDLSADKLEGFSSSIKLSLKGLSEEDANKKIQEALATTNNELAEQVIGTWETTTSTVSRQIQSTFMEMEAGAEAYRTVEETITTSTYVASEYAREGEKAIDTLTRLATNLSTVNSVFENLGVTLYQSSLAGADLANALTDAFGGIEAFISTTSYFYENFYSQTEKFVNQQRQLTSVFDQYGVALPQSKEEFRRLLESIDLTTDSGIEMYATLMKIAPAFVQFKELAGQVGASTQALSNTFYNVADAAENTKKAPADAAARAAEELAQKEADLARKRLEMYKQIYTLEGKEVEAREVELQLRALDLAAMDASLRPLQEMIYSLEDFAKSSDKIKSHLAKVSEEANRLTSFAQSNTDKAYAALERSVNKQLEAAQETANTASKVKDRLQGIFDLLESNIRELYGEVTSTRSMLSSEGRNLIAQSLRTGVLPDQEKLSEAISAVRSGLDETIYTTKFQADKEKLLFGIELSNLQETAEGQLTEAEKQRKASEDTIKYLEDVLTTAKEQIDALRGIDLSVINVETAINNLAAAMRAEGSLQETKNKLLLQGTGQAVYDVTSGVGTNAAGQVFERNALIEATSAHLAQGTVQAALDIYRLAASSGYSMGQLETIYGLPAGTLAPEVDKLSEAVGVTLPKFASGGMHSGGLRIVGENGPELEATGPSRIWNAHQTASMLESSSDSQTASEVRALREENKAQSLAIVQLQTRLTKIIERWDGDGLPETRVL